MTDTAPDQTLNGQPRVAPADGDDRLSVAWQRCADALVDEAQTYATALIDETATTVRSRLAHAIRSVPSQSPTSTDALLLGASIGLVSAALLLPRASHA